MAISALFFIILNVFNPIRENAEELHSEEEQALAALQQLGLASPPDSGKEIKYDAEGNHI